MHFLDYDSKFMQGLSIVTAGVWISILMAITSLPILTIGASLTAGHDACRHILTSKGSGMTKDYFHSFARNFAHATGIWSILLPIALALAWSWWCVFDTVALIPKIAFTLIWLMCVEWVFYLQSRFTNSVWKTIRNAAIFSLSHWVTTIALIGIDAAYIALIILSIRFFPQGLFLLIVLGYGNILLLHVPILEYAMRSQISDPRNEKPGEKHSV